MSDLELKGHEANTAYDEPRVKEGTGDASPVTTSASDGDVSKNTPPQPAFTKCSELLAIEGNDRCFDCNTESPLWVNVSYCVFLCAPCAAIHAEFGLLLKPLAEEKNVLTSEEMKLLSKTGNKVAGKYWHAAWDDKSDEMLTQDAGKDARTKYIVEKYRGKYLTKQARSELAKEKHVFCSQPAFYPTYQPYVNTNTDPLTTEFQQLSVHNYSNGASGDGATNGYIDHSGYAHANGYGEGSGYSNGNEYSIDTGYTTASAYGYEYMSGYGHDGEYANESGYENGYENGYISGYPVGSDYYSADGYTTLGNEQLNGYDANSYPTGYMDQQYPGIYAEGGSSYLQAENPNIGVDSDPSIAQSSYGNSQTYDPIGDTKGETTINGEITNTHAPENAGGIDNLAKSANHAQNAHNECATEASDLVEDLTNNHTNDHLSGDANEPANEPANEQANSFTNGHLNPAKGQTNERAKSHTKSHANGRVRNHPNGHINGHANWYANGHANGRANGYPPGIPNIPLQALLLAQYHAQRGNMLPKEYAPYAYPSYTGEAVYLNANIFRSGKEVTRNECAPAFVMNNPATYAKRGRRNRKAR